jgi:hypothetical protein
MREHNLALTDMGQLSKREEAFMSSLAEKIPGIGIGIKASNRAYSGFLNKLRADVFDDMVRKAKEMGIEDPTTLRGIADYVNTATGRGSLGKLEGKAAILNATLFSPKLMASRLKLLSPTYYMSLPPQVRREAVKDLFRFTALGMSILGLAKLSGASVEEDPRNPDFAKIKVGNTRYDIFGGFSQYIRLAAQLITGETVSSKTGEVRKLGEGYKPDTRKDVLERFVESKESPILSFATKLLEGKDYLGNEFNVGKEIIGMTLPFVVQDMYDLYKEWGPSGIPMSIPGIVGVGSQTYGKEIPTMGETSSGNPTIKMTPVPGLPETIYNELTNTPVSNIPEEQWGDIMQAREAGKAATEKKTQEKATSEETAKKLFDLLSTVPEGEKPAKVEDMINSGQISNDVAKKLNDLIKKSSYSPVSEEGKIISALGSNEEKANYIINYINKNPDSKKEFMSDLINSGVINNSLAKLIIERSGE